MDEENKALMKRFVAEYQTNHDEAVLHDLVSEDFVDHSAAPGLPPGRDGVKALFDAFHRAFAGFTGHIHDQVAELDAATALDDGDPDDLAARYARLREDLPRISVLGGCCGTDSRHIDAIRRACTAA